MDREPRYVDFDETFEDQIPWRRRPEGDPGSAAAGLSYPAAAFHALVVCGKYSKRFASEREWKRWRKIDKQVKADKIPLGWVYAMIEWASKKNTGRIAIKFPKLMNAILNEERMNRWISEQEVDEYSTETIKTEADDWY